MKTLNLHIGHGKTGSSFLQGVLASSVDRLSSLGYSYPLDNRSSQAKLGNITSGNGHMLIETLLQGTIHTPLEQALDSQSSMILSSEFFPYWMGVRDIEAPPSSSEDVTPVEFITRLKAWSERHHFERISILLFVRNPISHISSLYQQNVKRHGETSSPEQLATGFLYPTLVAGMLESLSKEPAIDLTVRNYSVTKPRLCSVLAEWLEIPTTELALPEKRIVNRSLSSGELELQRQFNIAIGKSNHLLADRLCNELPEIPADHVSLPAHLQENIWANNLPAIHAVNKFLPLDESYQFDKTPEKNEEPVYAFNKNQLSLIASSLGSAIADATHLSSADTSKHISQLTIHADELEKQRDSLQCQLKDESAKKRKLEASLRRERGKLEKERGKKRELQLQLDRFRNSTLYRLLKPLFKLEAWLDRRKSKR